MTAIAKGYSIDRGIKVPPKSLGRPKGSGKYSSALRHMKAGDSVLVTTAVERTGFLSASASLKCKVVSRKEEDGYRIWKVS